MPITSSQNAPIDNETQTTNTTLRAAVATHIKQTLEMDGIDAAKAELKTLAEMFSFATDWPSIYNEVASYLMRQKKQAEQAEAEHKEKVEEAWINAMAKNGFTGQLNFLTGKDATAPFFTTPMGGDKQ
jgi:Na+-translocating ferredoxin:NAD+ oxidoreductase RnfG subunit